MQKDKRTYEVLLANQNPSFRIRFNQSRKDGHFFIIFLDWIKYTKTSFSWNGYQAGEFIFVSACVMRSHRTHVWSQVKHLTVVSQKKTAVFIVAHTKNSSKAASISPASSPARVMSYHNSLGAGGSCPFILTSGVTTQRPMNSSWPFNNIQNVHDNIQ